MLRRLVAGLAPAVTIVLAGCTSSGAVDDAELTDPVVIVDGRAGAPVAEVPVISTEEQLLSYSALPLDAYSLDSDMFTIQVAEHSLLAECMAKQGFELEPSPPRRATGTRRASHGWWKSMASGSWQRHRSTDMFRHQSTWVLRSHLRPHRCHQRGRLRSISP